MHIIHITRKGLRPIKELRLFCQSSHLNNKHSKKTLMIPKKYITSAKEVMLQLLFICLIVNKIA